MVDMEARFHQKENELDAKFEEKEAQLEARLEEQEEELAVMKTQLLEAAEKPGEMLVCGFQDYWQEEFSAVHYDSFLSSYSDLGHGGLDLETGVFRAPVGGHYMVTFSGEKHN